ncbi:metallophosphoesterase family protein [Gloeobacter kilaueensis]|uniref:Metallophosphoesterase n=1 Tax=Gloeobacter kilaueensis (strain ATCC BAA-2537 / CCAP 1431/1 / ULC 316 / JS1) TaxID=1183438 RepID=U5QNW0_GLOK1|nr:metallophosphoesterase [Gloeobacter kilaueensis]AGY60578.1 metallophosphoesterase [Gloeobacter kilaueensis JS1]
MERRRFLQAGIFSLAALTAGRSLAASKAIGPSGFFAPPRGDVRIVLISDLNSEYGSLAYEPQVIRAVSLIPSWQPDLVLCSGDMVAGQWPPLKAERIQQMWAAFDRQIAAPLRRARLPFGITVGNHDASCERAIRGGFLYKKERDLASAYWNDPAHATGVHFVDRADFPFYYTFTANNIFYLAWDASCAHIPSEQLAWAEKSLASPAAQNARLRIVIGHLPLYAVAVDRETPGEYLENGEALRSMLERYRVHTYISGHDHAYYPSHRGKLQLLQTGALGSGPRPLLEGALRPWHPLTVIDIDLASQNTVYTTYDMATGKVFDVHQLPRTLMSPTGLLLRRDIEWQNLSADEQGACLKRFGEKGCR